MITGIDNRMPRIMASGARKETPIQSSALMGDYKTLPDLLQAGVQFSENYIDKIITLF